jgi:hypothetical protein
MGLDQGSHSGVCVLWDTMPRNLEVPRRFEKTCCPHLVIRRVSQQRNSKNSNRLSDSRLTQGALSGPNLRNQDRFDIVPLSGRSSTSKVDKLRRKSSFFFVSCCSLLGLLFHPEDGGSMSLGMVSDILPDYTASRPR